VLTTAGEAGFYWTLKLSPDGKRLAYQGRLRPFDNDDIFVLDLERGGTIRITSDPAQDQQPVWSPDGKYVAYGSLRSGSLQLFRRAGDGSGPEERIRENALGLANFTDWTSDGRYVVTFHRSPRTQNDIWLLPLDGSTPFPVVETDASDTGGFVSPNGRWIAYRSEESGRPELYVHPFNPSAGKPVAGRKWIVSQGGALCMPFWHRNGREILYIASDGYVMSVAVTTEPASRPARRSGSFSCRGTTWRSRHFPVSSSMSHATTSDSWPSFP
jgi:Tol biopolymer transport system component